LVNNPRILFLDEPTSGLDSFAALTVIENLRKLAYTGKTIICSIHQPSAEIAKLFDNLMVLSEGQTVFFGPANHAIDYFSKSLGYTFPKYINPVEVIIDLIQKKKDDDDDNDSDPEIAEEMTSPKLEALYESYEKSEYSKYMEEQIQNVVEEQKELPELAENYLSFFRQFSIIISRMFLNIFREPRLFRVRLMMGIFTSVLAGLIWLRLPLTFTGGTERIASSFFLVSSVMFAASSGPITLFAVERAVFYREHNGGMYGAGAFYLAKVVSELPLNIIAPVISSCIGFWLMGLHDDFVSFFDFYCLFGRAYLGCSWIGNDVGFCF